MFRNCLCKVGQFYQSCSLAKCLFVLAGRPTSCEEDLNSLKRNAKWTLYSVSYFVAKPIEMELSELRIKLDWSPPKQCESYTNSPTANFPTSPTDSVAKYLTFSFSFSFLRKCIYFSLVYLCQTDSAPKHGFSLMFHFFKWMKNFRRLLEVIVTEVVCFKIPFQNDSHSTCLLIDFDIWRYLPHPAFSPTKEDLGIKALSKTWKCVSICKHILYYSHLEHVFFPASMANVCVTGRGLSGCAGL